MGGRSNGLVAGFGRDRRFQRRNFYMCAVKARIMIAGGKWVIRAGIGMTSAAVQTIEKNERGADEYRQ
jgi:hypothetical protein